jgi:aryl-alcohol dehydrogenase-like predicted oxidoreductase
MEARNLGLLKVPELGLGCMGMSAYYGPSDRDEGIGTINRSIELGGTFFDTAEMYGAGENEKLLGEAVAGRRAAVTIATKFAAGDFAANAGFKNGSPENVRRAIDGSLTRLGTDYVDLYYMHRMDPEVPIEETMGALVELIDEGKILHIGLSEASAETLRRANSVHPVAALQVEYSLFTRHIEDEILPTCRELGIGVVAYSPLGRGFLSGVATNPDELQEDDFRKHLPRFSGDNLAKNQALVAKLDQIAEAEGVTSSQLALAWCLGKGGDIVPIPGTRRIKFLELNIAAADIRLSDETTAALDELGPQVAGERYMPAGMASVQE